MLAIPHRSSKALTWGPLRTVLRCGYRGRPLISRPSATLRPTLAFAPGLPSDPLFFSISRTLFFNSINKAKFFSAHLPKLPFPTLLCIAISLCPNRRWGHQLFEKIDFEVLEAVGKPPLVEGGKDFNHCVKLFFAMHIPPKFSLEECIRFYPIRQVHTSNTKSLCVFLHCKNRKGFLKGFFLVSEAGLEPARSPIRPSNVRVCLFRHSDWLFNHCKKYYIKEGLLRQELLSPKRRNISGCDKESVSGIHWRRVRTYENRGTGQSALPGEFKQPTDGAYRR